jgi:hypothetical protein
VGGGGVGVVSGEWIGVLVHAFVAAVGVLQNGKLSLCNFVVEISEGFWQLLIFRCGRSPLGDLQNYSKTMPTIINSSSKINEKWSQKL